MTSLRTNLVKRIDRLPKPANLASAMQPLFEAISNAIHSTQAKFGNDVTRQGRVEVTEVSARFVIFCTLTWTEREPSLWLSVRRRFLG